MRTVKLLLAGLCLGVAAAYSQAEHTTVVKATSNNPSIGILDFRGNAETRKKLEEMLERCGWFNVYRDAQARTADIKVNAAVGGQGAISTAVKAGNKTFTTASTATGQTAVQETVDSILKQLFNVKGLCTSRIFYVVPGAGNKKEIFSCFLDGSGVQQETCNNAISTEPSWGNSNNMVYTLAKNNALCIVQVDKLNNRQRVVSKSPGLNASAGLSHSGSRLALPLSMQGQVDLYYVDINDKGKHYVRITKDRNVESSPCWSGDDSKIVFVSDKLGVPQLYMKDMNTGAEKRISTGNNECVSPEWSEVSNKLCYSMKDNSGQRVICVMDMADPNLPVKVVTRASGLWEAPSWAPDGRHIVCTRSDASGVSRTLYIVDTWTNGFRPVFAKSPKLSLPAWRPAN